MLRTIGDNLNGADSYSLTDNQELIIEACKRDLGKATFEVYLTEIDWCRNDILFVCDNLEKWVKDESAPDIPLMNKLLRPKIRKDPLGAVLIIGYVKLIRHRLHSS